MNAVYGLMSPKAETTMSASKTSCILAQKPPWNRAMEVSKILLSRESVKASSTSNVKIEQLAVSHFVSTYLIINAVA